jgi:hypothetical protein
MQVTLSCIRAYQWTLKVAACIGNVELLCVAGFCIWRAEGSFCTISQSSAHKVFPSLNIIIHTRPSCCPCCAAGSFSIIGQSIALKVFPPLTIIHTDTHTKGQMCVLPAAQRRPGPGMHLGTQMLLLSWCGDSASVALCLARDAQARRQLACAALGIAQPCWACTCMSGKRLFERAALHILIVRLRVSCAY